jgi:hypothetical protein
MNGGEISGNETTTTATVDVAGGVVMGLNTEFIMNGGKISGNTAPNPIPITDYTCGGVYCSNGASFTMNNGEISGNTGKTGGVYSTGNIITINGGKINSNVSNTTNGIVVTNAASCKITMNGGEISGNTGIGVYSLTNSGGFTMNGGKISGNTSPGSAGGARTTGSPFTMIGGEISGNTGAQGGGLFASNTVTITGGKITGNTSTANNYAGGITMTSGTITMTGGEISNNTATVRTDIYVSSTTVILAESVSLDNIAISVTAPINIAPGWSGSVTNLHLFSTSSSITDVADAWVNQQVLLGRSPYTLTTADILKFANVFFLTNDGFKQNIAVNTGSGTYRISPLPASFGKLIKN